MDNSYNDRDILSALEAGVNKALERKYESIITNGEELLGRGNVGYGEFICLRDSIVSFLQTSTKSKQYLTYLESLAELYTNLQIEAFQTILKTEPTNEKKKDEINISLEYIIGTSVDYGAKVKKAVVDRKIDLLGYEPNIRNKIGELLRYDNQYIPKKEILKISGLKHSTLTWRLSHFNIPKKEKGKYLINNETISLILRLKKGGWFFIIFQFNDYLMNNNFNNY